MKLYHASSKQFEVIKRQQVDVPDGLKVPAAELQNVIYFTPYFGFALAMAAGPKGMTIVEQGTISFENESQFDPEKIVYVYEVESALIPAERIQRVDDEQYVVDLDEVVPTTIHTRNAQDVFTFYRFQPWV